MSSGGKGPVLTSSRPALPSMTACHLPHWTPMAANVDSQAFSTLKEQFSRLSTNAATTSAQTEANNPQNIIVLKHPKGSLDPNSSEDVAAKVQQLEKNLAFVKDQHKFMLKSLHEEIDQLKRKNRELQFQVVMGNFSQPSVQKPTMEKAKENENPDETQQRLERLDKEVKKLRNSLRETLKNNTCLTTQLEMMKREQYLETACGHHNMHYLPHAAMLGTPRHCAMRERPPTPHSPNVDDYSHTLQQIQRAASFPNTRMLANERRHSDYMAAHHHHDWKAMGDPQSQLWLPRLPFRNQGIQEKQYDNPFKHRAPNILPALKPQVFPNMLKMGDKFRKPHIHPQSHNAQN